MPSYREMYFTLLRAQRDAILILQEGHQKAEELLLSFETPDHLSIIFPGSEDSLSEKEAEEIQARKEF